MDNTSSNYNPQGDDYKIFIDRYKDSLIPENGQYNDNKADIYLKSIVKKVENEYNHDQYDSNIKLNFDKGYKAKDEDVKNKDIAKHVISVYDDKGSRRDKTEIAKDIVNLL